MLFGYLLLLSLSKEFLLAPTQELNEYNNGCTITEQNRLAWKTVKHQ